jgi:hypothetical protein
MLMAEETDRLAGVDVDYYFWADDRVEDDAFKSELCI